MRTRGTNANYFGDDNKAFIAASATTSPDLRFATNSAEIMRLTNSGNVGIGTATPQAGFVVTNGNVGIGTWAPVNTFGVVGNAAIGSYAGVNIAPTSGLVVSGNVGIGTFAPTMTMQVVGTGIRVGNGNFENPTGASDLYVAGNLEVDGSVWLGDLATDSLTVIGRMSMTGGMTIDNLEVTGNTFLGTSNGNVGIGTTVADASLEIVKKNANPLLMLSATAAGNGNYVMIDSVGNVGIGTNSTAQSALQIMNGNMGIGTWVAGKALDVKGDMRTSNNISLGNSITDSSDTARITITSTSVDVNLQ